MKTFLALSLFLFATVNLFAQTSKYHLNCSTMYSTGCTSFNEMLDKDDKDLLHDITNYDRYVVCFREGADVFMSLTFDDPDPTTFRKVSEYASEKSGFMTYSRYKQGVLDDSHFISGKWTKLFAAGGSTFFDAPEKSSRAGVTDIELEFAYDYTNLNSTTTHYHIQVRRSTLRFYENLQWPGNPTAKAAEERAPGSADYSGHCVQVK